ncbi:MAG: radical SAM family heme chaperone HemW [Armatimonadota bacterium]|nr:radical SAM family heme chaperone HemW [bacterium]MCS7309331.1 radical SAM family heme chaperone HemW [Armatimonadota bacterium]MDW8289737.1 radical SAM family heme chaperone HemW [Armatimonadota bacterium]
MMRNTIHPKPLSIYVHIPFCARRCAYCDFNTYAWRGGIVRDTLDAIRAHIESTEADGVVVPTIFFGGGTPTFPDPELIIQLLDTIRTQFTVLPDAEISIEANPGTVDRSRFAALRQAGFNRLSIGVQAFDDRLLRVLGRLHTAQEAICSYEAARAAGFENVNLDLMFALPGQTLSQWRHTLRTAISLQPEHLSCYALTVEPNTPFYSLYQRGQLPLPDEETDLRMYQYTIRALTRAGYEHYEISNFARPGYRCRHNLVYWRNEEYLGFGPGAVSYRDGVRWKWLSHPRRYVQAVRGGGSLVEEEERLSLDESLGETVMLMLRTRDGVDVKAVESRYGVQLATHYAPVLRRLRQLRLLEVTSDRWRITPKGLPIANTVCAEFLV